MNISDSSGSQAEASEQRRGAKDSTHIVFQGLQGSRGIWPFLSLQGTQHNVCCAETLHLGCCGGHTKAEGTGSRQAGGRDHPESPWLPGLPREVSKPSELKAERGLPGVKTTGPSRSPGGTAG